MNYRKLLLAIFVALIIIGIFFFYNKSTQYKSQRIDVSSYEKTSSGLLSKYICENDNSCKQKFNEYWKCQEIDNSERCVCIIPDENNPVCGVDGKTYRNPSETNCLEVKIDYEGECKQEGGFCQKCGNECITNPRLTDRECNEPTEDFECIFINDACEKRLREFGLPFQGKECASNKDCQLGYYCKEETACTNAIPPSCTTISNCVLRLGCGDVVCNYTQEESSETCPQDCKESLKQKTCNEISLMLNEEISKIKFCNTDAECVSSGNLSFRGGAPVLCCGLYAINKNSDTSTLITLNEEYKADCSSNFSVNCACVDARNLKIACINNQCGVKWPS